jgi:hypothetical protein
MSDITALNSMTGSLSEEFQRELLIEYLYTHKKIYLQNFFADKSLPYSYSKRVLKDKLSSYAQAGQQQLDDLINLLDKIEGWGRQHVYLYTAPSTLSAEWRQEEVVRRYLTRSGHEGLLNQKKTLILPDEPTLTSIEWTPDRVRFIWVEKRVWHDRDTTKDETIITRREKSDFIREQIVLRAYRVRLSRGLITFDWDLNTNHAMMLIQRLPRGNQYVSTRDTFEKALTSIFAINTFEKARVSRSLRSIENCDETRRHHMTFQSTHNRGTIAVTSPHKKYDVFSHDSVIERARNALDIDATGLLGNFYWKPVAGQLSCEVYTHIYGIDDNDQRVGILAEHTEEDVRYVLSRIRAHCV